MKCETLQLNLSLYAEGILADDEREILGEHLAQCPLCRLKLAEFKSLQNDLRALPVPELPRDLLYSVKNVVATELKRAERKSSPLFSANLREWLQYRLMPYSVGTIASLILTFSLLLTLLSTKEATQKGVETAQKTANRPVIIASNSNPKFNDSLYGSDYSLADLPIADESPSINPTGALMALTKSIVRGKMKDEEVVIVADVFGDGIAKIAEVVEAPHDQKALNSLEKAFSRTRGSAPFVPANRDNRSDVVRVILKIQQVDVIEKPSKSAPKYH